MAAKKDIGEASAADGLVREAPGIPFDKRLPGRVPVRKAPLHLVHRLIAEDLGERAEELAAVLLLLMRARRVKDGAAAVEIHLVVVLAAHGDASLWRELHVQSRAGLVLAAGGEHVGRERPGRARV